MRMIRQHAVLFFLIPLILFSCKNNINEYDICIYGGTSAGVVAANAARKLGKTVILIEPGKHLGGLSSSGLGSTDIGNKHAVTGISRDFYRRLGKHYNKLEAWTFEPKEAEKIFEQYIQEQEVEVLRNYRLRTVYKEGEWIKQIELESSIEPAQQETKIIKARVFLDCTYEGDLMAKSGVEYFTGREANTIFNERYNGVQLMDKHQFPDGIDPYKTEGDSSSGLCWGISPEALADSGSGDSKIQAYNFRLCWTQDKNNQVSFLKTKPEDYDSSTYELLLRVMKQYESQNPEVHNTANYFIINIMPNGKTDINNRGSFSTDYIGGNYTYPEADYETRKKIAREHENYIKGLIYFICTDSRVPVRVQNDLLSWGWCKDEFTDNGYFPHQLYVREARRMKGEYVMTEHNCWGDSTVSDGVGLAAYTMDSHNCQRLVIKKNGKAMVKNEGNVEIGDFPPFEISYRSLTPKRDQCKNLLVPVCLSATHIAYGSIRMEPVFMVMAQVSAMAAVIAVDKKLAVQEIDVKALMEKYEQDPLLNGQTPDVLVDNSDSLNILITGNWKKTSRWMGQYKTDYLFSQQAKGKTSIKYYPEIKREGKYAVYLYFPQKSSDLELGYEQVVPVIVSASDETIKTEYISSELKKDWIDMGIFTFSPGKRDFIEIDASGADSVIVADAVLFVPQF